VGGVTYAYDNNGNLTSDSTWTHTWNYANQLTQSQKTGSTVTYQYDHTGQRTKYYDGVSGYARHYPNKLYNIKQTTATKHIYAGSQLIGTVEGTTLQYLHTDHLTGSNAATNSSGGMVQLLDYYPYGSMRIDWKSGSFDEQRKFTGHEFDRDTSLTYANARYYKQGIGRFLSQDPVYLTIGVRDGAQSAALLSNPQGLNSYAYANNNPMKYIDPFGTEPVTFSIAGLMYLAVEAGFTVWDVYDLVKTWLNPNSTKIQKSITLAGVGIGLLSVGGGYGKAARLVAGHFDNVADASKGLKGAKAWASPTKYKEHYLDHASEFGARSADEYTDLARDFLQRAQSDKLPTKIDKDGIVRVYDEAANTLGSYNPDGTIRTFFKPDPAVHGQGTNLDYWNNQQGELVDWNKVDNVIKE